MSRYLRIRRGVSGVSGKGKRGAVETLFAVKAKGASHQALGGSDKRICGVEHTILALIQHTDLHIYIHTVHLIKITI